MCLNVTAVEAENVSAGGSVGPGDGQIGNASMIKIDRVDDELEITGHWGRCPTMVPIERPKEHPPAPIKPYRTFFGRDENICGSGDASTRWIHDEEKRFKPALNRVYDVYQRNDEKRERSLSKLIVKNGCGLLDRFEFSSIGEAKKKYGEAQLNSITRGDRAYSERDTYVFELDAIDRETGSFSKFRLAVYAPNNSPIEYALEGPGIVCGVPVGMEVASIMQFLPEVGAFWVDVRSDETKNLCITETDAINHLLTTIDKRLNEKKYITPIPDPRTTGVFRTSGRSERHQRTSPTLPEGPPIPDSR